MRDCEAKRNMTDTGLEKPKTPGASSARLFDDVGTHLPVSTS
jgi:hypothetical protein